MPGRFPGTAHDALLSHVMDSSIGLVCAYASPMLATSHLPPSLISVWA